MIFSAKLKMVKVLPGWPAIRQGLNPAFKIITDADETIYDKLPEIHFLSRGNLPYITVRDCGAVFPACHLSFPARELFLVMKKGCFGAMMT